MSKRLPVTIVTGFLGSGKTTLLRQLLLNSGKRLAVMINEFGSVGLDGDLIRTCGFCPEEEVEGRLVELNNGCLCCTVQDDFLPTIESLLSRSDKLDGIIIETSGLALPDPLLQALDWPLIRSRVHLNGVVTMVDGEALSTGSPISDISAIDKQRKEDPSLDHLTSVDELFADQLNCADLVLISRADCVSSIVIEDIKSKLVDKVTPGTPFLPIQDGNISPSLILGLDQTYASKSKNQKQLAHDHESHHHVHLCSSALRIEANIDKASLEQILFDLSIQYQIVRLKGRCWFDGKEVPLQIQMVGSRFTSWYEASPKSAWSPMTAGLELVVMSFLDGADEAIRLAIEKTVGISG